MAIKMEYLILCVGLFILLSPGLFLTLPPLSARDAISLGVSYGPSGSANLCPNDSNFGDEAQCTHATTIWRSGFTSFVSVFIHAVVYAVLLHVATRYLGLPKIRSDETVYLAALFIILSPGLLLTLPRLSPATCGFDSLNISDDGEFCSDEFKDGANCKMCTSWILSRSTQPLSVLVHAVLLGVILQFGKLV